MDGTVVEMSDESKKKTSEVVESSKEVVESARDLVDLVKKDKE